MSAGSDSSGASSGGGRWLSNGFRAFPSWRTKNHAAGSSGSVGGSHSSGGSDGGGRWLPGAFLAFSSWRTKTKRPAAAAVSAVVTATAVAAVLVVAAAAGFRTYSARSRRGGPRTMPPAAWVLVRHDDSARNMPENQLPPPLPPPPLPLLL